MMGKALSLIDKMIFLDFKILQNLNEIFAIGVQRRFCGIEEIDGKLIAEFERELTLQFKTQFEVAITALMIKKTLQFDMKNTRTSKRFTIDRMMYKWPIGGRTYDFCVAILKNKHCIF